MKSLIFILSLVLVFSNSAIGQKHISFDDLITSPEYWVYDEESGRYFKKPNENNKIEELANTWVTISGAFLGHSPDDGEYTLCRWDSVSINVPDNMFLIELHTSEDFSKCALATTYTFAGKLVFNYLDNNILFSIVLENAHLATPDELISELNPDSLRSDVVNGTWITDSTTIALHESKLPEIDKKAKHISFSLFEGNTYHNKYIPEYDLIHSVPQFEEKTKQLDGDLIIISGYVYPIAPNSGFYLRGDVVPDFTAEYYSNPNFLALRSNFNLQKCKAKTPYTFTGRLKLNADDPFQLVFILLDAKLVLTEEQKKELEKN